MDLGSFYAFLTAIGFKTNNLAGRWLQEKGAAISDTYTIYRYALIPAVIWGLIFVRQSDLSFIFHSHKLLIIIATTVVLWNLQAYLMALVINSTNSMLLFSTIFNMLLLSLFLAFGVFFNHDKPNFFSIAAIVVLMAALLVKPTPHKDNLRPRLSRPLYTVVILIFLKACCDTVLQGIGREGLKQVDPPVFLAAFSVPTLVVCWIISKFYIHSRVPESQDIKQRQWLAIGLIPMIWFVASIPEAYSLAAIPIYTFISINVVTYGMDTVSDIWHKRLSLSLQTVGFIALVLVGISLSVLSV